jgi:hypothetical protein
MHSSDNAAEAHYQQPIISTGAKNRLRVAGPHYSIM